MAIQRNTLLERFESQPGSVVFAALLGMTAGGITLVGSVIVFGTLVTHVGADWFRNVAWLVAVAQVAAAVLLIAGGLRLAVGAGRTVLVAGATLHLLVCAVYVLYAQTAVADDTTEPPSTVAIFTAIPLVFAALSGSSLLLALRRNHAAASGVEGV